MDRGLYDDSGLKVGVVAVEGEDKVVEFGLDFGLGFGKIEAEKDYWVVDFDLGFEQGLSGDLL